VPCLGGSSPAWKQTSVHPENMGGTSYCYQPYLAGKDPNTAPPGRTWYDYGCPAPGYDKFNRQVLADATAFHKGRGQHWGSVQAGFNTLMTDGHVKFFTTWYQMAYTWY
jgi:prepilin-type processing-associated H-X9-DG protein